MRRKWIGKLPGLILLTISLAISACTTLGPEYEEPNVEWLDSWHSSNLIVKSAESQSDVSFWWHMFEDPNLNGLILTAKKENSNLRIAGIRILEARAMQGVVGSSLYPQFKQASGSVNYVHSESHDGLFSELTDGSKELASYKIGINAGWELDFWGRFKRSVESADAAFFTSVANQQTAQVLVSATVAELYFAYRTLEERIKIANENVSRQKRSYEITQRIFKHGGESELDLQQARTQYLATLASIPQLEASLIRIRNALSVLINQPPGDIPALSANKLQGLPSIEAIIPPVIPSNLLIRRPDVRAAAWQVATQSAQIGVAQADYYPAISLVGGLNWSGDDRNISPSLGVFSLGPSVKWNLFDQGRISNNIRIQDARLQQLIENYQATVLQAAREVDDAAITVQKTAETHALLEESLEAAERSFEIANNRYIEGYADFQRVLDAQRNLFTQAERTTINHGAYLDSMIKLYKGLGGGWVKTPIDKLVPENVKKSLEQRVDWGGLLSAPLPELYEEEQDSETVSYE